MKLKKIAKTAVLLMLAVAVIGGLLLAVGLRLVLDGGGGVSLAFPKSASKQAEDLAKHREAQRAQTRVTPAPNSAIYWTSFRGPQRDGFTASNGSHRLADRRDATAVEAADRRRLRIVCHR